ncbi:MAG: SLC13 family permease [Haloarculaceae archaeon]
MEPTTGMVVVFGLVAVAIVLFVTESFPSDVTAIGIVVSLVVLREYTHVTPAQAVSGFSSPATITIIALYILSAGVQRTGIVTRLGVEIARVTDGTKSRLLGIVVVITSVLAGFINNTPVVAVFVPMVTDLADRNHISPSKLLIPLSYASMLGGTLTLIGTSMNVVASDLAAGLSAEYPGLHPFSMFEFTALGIAVAAVGIAYLLTVSQRLLPERIAVVDLTEKYGLGGYLSRVYVPRDSPLVGSQIGDALEAYELDLDVVQIVRGAESFMGSSTDREIEAGDVLTIHARDPVRQAFVDGAGLRRLPRATVTEDELSDPERKGTLVEVVVPAESSLAGRTVADSRLRERFADTLLAVRRGGETIHEGLSDLTLSPGDALLLHASESSVQTIRESDELVITEEAAVEGPPETPPVGRDAVLAVSVVVGVVAIAALGLLPIAIAALGGVFAMVVLDIIDPGAAYDAVSWEIVFLLAGVYPLGLAMQQTGGAEFLGGLIVGVADVLPAVVVLALFYLLTGLLANVITPVASVVLVFPVAIDAAARIGADTFAFALGVTFAASTAFMTPVGYQTNLMVYSPGGYRFSDYVRVGAPLQLLLAVVTPLLIDLLWTV